MRMNEQRGALDVIALVGIVGVIVGAGAVFWIMRGEVADAKAALTAVMAGANECAESVKKQNKAVEEMKAQGEADRKAAAAQLEKALKDAQGFYRRAAGLSSAKAKATDPAGICREAEALVDDYLAMRRQEAKALGGP